MNQITLYFKDDKSDKVYRAEIMPEGDGYVVNFAYGRRGGILTTGTKTKSPVPLDEAKTIYDKLVKEKTSKGYSERTKWRNKVMVEYGQFYVQPRKRPDTCFADFGDDEQNQRFVSFPRHATIFIDEEVWMIYVDSELASVAPELGNAVQAICVPIDVTDDYGLFLRSVNDEDEEDQDTSDDDDESEDDDDVGDGVGDELDYSLPQKIDLPRGEYDMFVRIFAAEGADEEEYDEDDEDGMHCKVSITFLPKGTIGPKVLKVNWFDFPSKLILHTSDGGIQELPNSAR